VKYAWIDGQRRDYPLPDMRSVLGVSIRIPSLAQRRNA
jgi:hypothetical protein